MLASLVIHNSFVSDKYTEGISDIKSQLHYLHLKKYFIEPKYNQNCQHLGYNYCVSTSVYMNTGVEKRANIHFQLILSTTKN